MHKIRGIYMQNVTKFSPKSHNLAYFTENNEKCESKFNLQLCSYGIFGYGQ